MQHCSVHLHWRTRMTLRSLMFYHSNWPKDKEWCNCTTIWLSDYLFHKFLERMLTRRDLMAIVVWSLVGTKSVSKVKNDIKKWKKSMKNDQFSLATYLQSLLTPGCPLNLLAPLKGEVQLQFAALSFIATGLIIAAFEFDCFQVNWLDYNQWWTYWWSKHDILGEARCRHMHNPRSVWLQKTSRKV